MGTSGRGTRNTASHDAARVNSGWDHLRSAYLLPAYRSHPSSNLVTQVTGFLVFSIQNVDGNKEEDGTFVSLGYPFALSYNDSSQGSEPPGVIDPGKSTVD